MRYAKVAFCVMAVLAAGAVIMTGCEMKTPEMMTPTAIVSEFSAQKDQYVADLQAKIDEYQMKIDELNEKADAMSGAAKDELNQKIAELTVKQEEARSKLEEIKAAGVETWDKVKSGADLILTDLETLYKDALSLVK